MKKEKSGKIKGKDVRIMKFQKVLVSRITFVSIALIFQIGILWFFSTYFQNIAKPTFAVLRIVSIFVIFTVLNQIKNPSIAMTWIVFIVIAPVFGSLVYLLFGSKKPGRKMCRAFKRTESRLKGWADGGMDEKELKEENEEVFEKSAYLRGQGFPVYKNTEVKYFSLGDEAFPHMLSELEKAEKFIFMEYFILEEGEMFDKILQILEKKAKDGVDVRIIYDDVGSLFTLPNKYHEILEKKGIKCFAFNPFVPVISSVMNNRNHRKIMVIDSRVAFTGGVNIADEYINKKEKYGHWKDNCMMLKGEGAKEFTFFFLQMWNTYQKNKEDVSVFFPTVGAKEEDVYVQPFSDTPVDDELVGENIFIDAISNSKKYVYIFTPYLIPDTVLLRSLTLAAKRGVDVRIFVPGIPDKKTVYAMTKSFYAPLISEGVKIYKYLPGFLHAKGFVADGNIACVGTVNMDFRSMYHHFECGCIIYGEKAVQEIEEDFNNTLKKCERIKLKKMKKSIFPVAIRAIMRLVAPLM